MPDLLRRMVRVVHVPEGAGDELPRRDFLDEQRFPLVQCPAIVVFDSGLGSLYEMRQAFKWLRSLYSASRFFRVFSTSGSRLMLSEIAGANTAGFSTAKLRGTVSEYIGEIAGVGGEA